MRLGQASTAFSRRGFVAGLAVLACLPARKSRADDEGKGPVTIRLAFDRPLDGSMAPFVLATSRGLFAAEGVSVTTSFEQGSPEAIGLVASGASEMALVDLNELIRYRSRADAPAIKAVFVLFNSSPYAIVARKSRGIHTLADIEGKTLGVAETDLSFHLWPALTRENGIKAASVKIYRMSAAVREPILSAGQVDAVAGFSYLSAVNLRDRGVPADDLAVLRYADYGCKAYGFAIVVNPDFAAGKGDAVKGFVRATISGTLLAIKNPARAADAVVKLMEDGSSDLELARLNTVISDNIVSAEVKRDGIGGVDPVRLERSIDQIGEDFRFHKRPAAADVFDDAFLPPLGGRLID
jgi:NitT/TauT family transport system substrate-binding protein